MKTHQGTSSGHPVQFFFNETNSRNEVSRFRFWDSRFENPAVAVEKRPPYLPQDQRSRADPYLGYPPRWLSVRVFVAQPSTLFVSPGSFFSSRLIPGAG